MVVQRNKDISDDVKREILKAQLIYEHAKYQDTVVT